MATENNASGSDSGIAQPVMPVTTTAEVEVDPAILQAVRAVVQQEMRAQHLVHSSAVAISSTPSGAGSSPAAVTGVHL